VRVGPYCDNLPDIDSKLTENDSNGSDSNKVLKDSKLTRFLSRNCNNEMKNVIVFEKIGENDDEKEPIWNSINNEAIEAKDTKKVSNFESSVDRKGKSKSDTQRHLSSKQVGRSLSVKLVKQILRQIVRVSIRN